MANKIVKWTGIGLLVSLAAIQLYRPEKNISESTPASDIVTAFQVPEVVASVLHRACYDCHSNNTKYPWYNNIQPVGIWLADHISEGKEELNFSEFGTFTPKRKLKKLKEIVEEVEEGEMPLESYTFVHGEAKLTADEKAMLIDWAKGLSQKIQMTEGAPQM